MGSFIVEFNGIPGSGKSTVERVLNDLCLAHQYSICREGELFSEKNRWKKWVFVLSILFYPKYFSLFIKVFLVGLSSFSRTKKTIPLKVSLTILYLTYSLIKRKKENDDFIIISEGYVQLLSNIYDYSSLVMNHQLESLISKIFTLFDDILIVNCYIDKELAVERVNNRKKEQCLNSIDKLDQEVMIKFMSFRDKNLRVIRKYIKDISVNSIDIRMDNDPKVNAESIINQMK